MTFVFFRNLVCDIYQFFCNLCIIFDNGYEHSTDIQDYDNKQRKNHRERENVQNANQNPSSHDDEVTCFTILLCFFLSIPYILILETTIPKERNLTS